MARGTRSSGRSPWPGGSGMERYEWISASTWDPGPFVKDAYLSHVAVVRGSLAVYEALYALESGRYRNALVIGVEKMSLLDADGVSRTLARCSMPPSLARSELIGPRARPARWPLPRGFACWK